MVFDKVQRGWRAVSLAAVAVAAGAALGAVSSPAAAEEDTNMFNSVLGFVGLQFDKEQDAIDYRARAPIVVPPRLDLPPPKQSARDASWPNDPDVIERRRAALSAKQPAPQLTPNARAELSAEEIKRGVGDLPKEGPPSECQSSAGTPICLYAPWKALQAAMSGDKEVVQPGVEPSRKYLTDPPPGYRRATAAVKATSEAVKEQTDAADPGAYIRSQQRKSSVE